MPEFTGASSHTPLRICLLSYRSDPNCGGQGVYIRHLSRALKALGHEVTVVSGPPDPSLDADIPLHRLPGLDLYNPEDPFRTPRLHELRDPVNLMEWLGVSTQGFPEPFTFGVRALRFMKRHRHRFDVLHDNQSLSYGVWSMAKQIPTVATIHHPVTVDRDIAVRAERNIFRKIKHLRWYSFIAMQKRVAQTLPCIITVSRAAQRDITTAFKVPAERFRIVPNGIDTRCFAPLPGIEREKGRIIVTNSADTPLKGLTYLLTAIAQVARTHPIRLVVVGSPKHNGHIRRTINQLGIDDRVTFTGRIDTREFVTQYAKAFAAAIPSVYEGFGLPAGEAMACKVPVISTNGGALPEVVGNAGIMVPTAAPEPMAKAIITLLDNPDLAHRLGEAGFKRVHRKFTWEKAAEKTVEAYRETMGDYR